VSDRACDPDDDGIRDDGDASGIAQHQRRRRCLRI